VPVELNVATILVAILALLPIPVTITRPFEFKMNLTAFSKLSSIKLSKLSIYLLSIKIFYFAVLIILSNFFKL
jgi:hypothetical protein